MGPRKPVHPPSGTLPHLCGPVPRSWNAFVWARQAQGRSSRQQLAVNGRAGGLVAVTLSVSDVTTDTGENAQSEKLLVVLLQAMKGELENHSVILNGISLYQMIWTLLAELTQVAKPCGADHEAHGPRGDYCNVILGMDQSDQYTHTIQYWRAKGK